jgi:ribokinase
VRWATAASSISVTRPGATSSMPRYNEVAALLV